MTTDKLIKIYFEDTHENYKYISYSEYPDDGEDNETRAYFSVSFLNQNNIPSTMEISLLDYMTWLFKRSCNMNIAEY